MPEERGLYPKMRVRDQLVLLRAAARARRRPPPPRPPTRWIERLGLADARRRPGRDAVARQPAAGAARRRARPRPGGARPRRAVLRPRPDRRGRHERRARGAGAGRRPGRLLQPPARARRAALRGRRDHQPRPARGPRRRGGAAGARPRRGAAGPRPGRGRRQRRLGRRPSPGREVAAQEPRGLLVRLAAGTATDGLLDAARAARHRDALRARAARRSPTSSAQAVAA